MRILAVLAAVTLTGCAAPTSQSNHQNLNVKECQALAEETFRSGKLNYDLCPGYMPNGQPVELF